MGTTAKGLGLGRVAVVTDAVVAQQPFFVAALGGLRAAGVDVVVYADTKVEPTDESFMDAARWGSEVR